VIKKYHYICPASHARVVNLAPILHVGYDGIAKVTVLRAFNDISAPRDQTEAIFPADDFKRFLEGKNIPVVFVDGHPHDVSRWQGVMSDILDKSGEQPILVNATSGTKPTSLGLIFAMLLGKKKNSVRVVMVSGDPLGITWPLEAAPGETASRNSITTDLKLDDYLKLYGLEDPDPAKRKQHEIATWCRRNKIKTLAGQFLSFKGGVPPNRVISIINRAATQYLNINQKFPVSIDDDDFFRHCTGHNARTAEQRISSVLKKCADVHSKITRNAAATTFASKEAVKFLCGGWFEEATYIALREANLGQGVQVHLNVHLTEPGPPPAGANRPYPISELDVAVLHNGQLHVIECKTALYSGAQTAGGVNRDTINKLATLRDRLMGPYGLLSIVNPRHVPNNATHASALKEHIQTQGKHLNVVFYESKDCLTQLTKELQTRFQ